MEGDGRKMGSASVGRRRMLRGLAFLALPIRRFPAAAALPTIAPAEVPTMTSAKSYSLMHFSMVMEPAAFWLVSLQPC